MPASWIRGSISSVVFLSEVGSRVAARVRLAVIPFFLHPVCAVFPFRYLISLDKYCAFLLALLCICRCLSCLVWRNILLGYLCQSLITEGRSEETLENPFDHRFWFFLVDLNFLFVLLKLCFSVTKPCFRYALFALRRQFLYCPLIFPHSHSHSVSHSV